MLYGSSLGVGEVVVHRASPKRSEHFSGRGYEGDEVERIIDFHARAVADLIDKRKSIRAFRCALASFCGAEPL